jgi:hypothetical protein
LPKYYSGIARINSAKGIKLFGREYIGAMLIDYSGCVATNSAGKKNKSPEGLELWYQKCFGLGDLNHLISQFLLDLVGKLFGVYRPMDCDGKGFYLRRSMDHIAAFPPSLINFPQIAKRPHTVSPMALLPIYYSVSPAQSSALMIFFRPHIKPMRRYPL